MATCPEGHTSASTDYCDVCGAKMTEIEAPPVPAAGPAAAAASLTCPNCHGANPAGALFCEACGYDFTTGSLPRMSSLAASPGAAAAPAGLGGLGGATAVRNLPPGTPDAVAAATTDAAPATAAPESVLSPAPVAAATPAANPFDLDAPVAPAAPVASTPVEVAPLEPPAAVVDDGDIVDADVIEDSAPVPAAPVPAGPVPDAMPVPAATVPDLAPAAPAAPGFVPDAAPAALIPDASAPVATAPVVPASDVPVPVAPATVVPEPAPVASEWAPGAPLPAAPVAAAAAAPVFTPVPPPPGVPAQAEPEASDLPAGKAEWVAEVWIDPDWYAGQASPDQLPSPGLPRIVGLRKRASLVGRPSKSRGIVPDVDCEPDTGVSRRHAELTTDGQRWWVEDLGSSNGTYVGQAGSPLPTEPVTIRTELGEDSRVYVGSWTRVVVRRANPDEVDL